MFSKEIISLLHKSIQLMPFLTCARSLKHDIDELVMMALPSMKLAVVDDVETAQAFGEQIFKALKGRFDCVHITLGKAPSADSDTVDDIRRQTQACEALVAVGSGIVNDLCKYASFLDKKPYIIFPTAASMNGYVSANASITVDGYKKTLPAHMPKAVFCDMSVIAAAPARLNKSGLGDALARPTAQADWLLSHLWLGTPYNETPFLLLRDVEPQLFAQARGIAMGDRDSIELLMHNLLLSGFGMTIAGGSYPASQGEHMIAHAMEMLSVRHSREGGNPVTLHGEEIGVTTLTMARLQEKMLSRAPALASLEFPREILIGLFGEKITAEAEKAYGVKQEKIRQAILPDWDNIAQRITQVMLPSSRIEAILKAAEAPCTPQALGWTEIDYNTALAHARFLRDRFTFLDVM